MSALEDFQRKMEQKYAAPSEPEVKVDPRQFAADMERKYAERSWQDTGIDAAKSVGSFLTNDTTVDAAKSLGSGLVKGTGSMLDQAQAFTPAGMVDNTIGWAQWAANKLYPDKVKPTNGATHLMTPDLAKTTSDITLGADKYEPKTTVGRYAKTTGEFLPSAMPFTPKGSLLGKGLNLVQNAVVPAVASEAASDLAKATGNEEYADASRIAAAVVSPGAVGTLGRKAAGIPSSVAGANPQRVKNADTLIREGLPVTAGQMSGNKALMAREGTTHAGVMAAEMQPEEYTKFVMRSIGSNADLATPDEIVAASNAIVDDLNRVADSVKAMPTQSSAKLLVDAVKNHKDVKGVVAPIVNKIMQAMIDAKRNGQPIDGSILRQWRTRLNEAAASAEASIDKSLYRKTIDSIDEMVSSNLKASGRADDWELLEQARKRYRNLLAIEPASIKANNGILDPNHVLSELNKQGKRSVARGTRGDLSEVSMAAKNVMTKIPKNERIPKKLWRNISSLAGGAGTLGTMLFYGGGLNPATLPLAGALGLAGAVVPRAIAAASDAAGNSVMWPSVQKMLMEEAKKPKGYNSLPDKILRSSTIANGADQLGLDERMGRKAGGRVNPHAAEADRLIAAAERAKKDLGGTTERLLNTPDDVVAHALEAANRSI